MTWHRSSSACRCFALCLLVLGGNQVRGAAPYQAAFGDPVLEPWRWRASAAAKRIAKYKGGTNWFGTAGGLSCYDGFESKRYLADDGVLASWVSAFFVHPGGMVIAGGWWGISQFSRGQWPRLIPAFGLLFADVRRMATAGSSTLRINRHSLNRGHASLALSSGRPRFEVRARDQNFIVDPTPATLGFVVLPPVWRQAWFGLLMILLGGLITTLTIRMFLDRSRLRRINRSLATEIDALRHAAEETHLLNTNLERRLLERTHELAVVNKELETFSYSVSHDLLAPLRSIDGFSRILLEDYTAKLDAEGQDSLRRISAATDRMGRLIDDLLNLARISRDAMQREEVDLSALAGMVAKGLRQADPSQAMEFVIAPNLIANCDGRLMQIVLENLFGNACKFSRGRPVARIEFGRTMREKELTFFVRDNGAGFDRSSAQKLFGAFQRFHSTTEFPGTGIGLATVQRIIHRHGGLVGAESQPDHGATFYFTLVPQIPQIPKIPETP